MNPSIEIDGLRKRFGSTRALDGMTFTVGPGQVTGFVGPNGAGKSTTIRVVLGLDAPDAGTAAIGLVLGVLYLFPLAAAVVSNPALARHLDQIGPLPAGLDAQATIGMNSLPLTPWQGLGVVTLWTAGALLLGVLVLTYRDA